MASYCSGWQRGATPLNAREPASSSLLLTSAKDDKPSTCIQHETSARNTPVAHSGENTIRKAQQTQTFCLEHFAAAVRRGRRVKGQAAFIWLFHISSCLCSTEAPADTDRTRDFRESSGPVLAETSAALMVKLSGGILCLNCCPMVSSPLHNNAPFVLHSNEPGWLTQHTQSETRTCMVRRLPLRLKHCH